MVELPSDDPGSLDRRALIRRAAVLGAAAWTAPVILDSLASPAGALTLPGCYLYVIALDRNGNSDNANASLSPDLNCAYQGLPLSLCDPITRITINGTAPVGTVTLSASYDDALEEFSFTFSEANAACYILATASTPGTSNATACEATPTFTATVGTPSSVTYAVSATDVNNVEAWAYVLVTCT